MSTTQQLQQKQTQHLVMTPHLRQAIKILELSQQDLNALIANELVDNPLLSLDEGDIPCEDVARDESQDNLEVDFNEQWSAHDTSHASASDPMDRIASAPISLREHLLEQIATDLKVPSDRFIASCLVDCLEDTGYLPKNYADALLKLGCEKEDIEAVLSFCQSMDPAGVFCRDLTECLKLQLIDRDEFSPTVQKVLNNLELIELGEIDRLLKICDLDTVELKQILSIIRSCDPKPGLTFSPSQDSAITPDVLLKRSADNGWTVSLCRSHHTTVTLDENLFKRLSQSKNDKKYISDKYSSAQNLLKAIEQRHRTLVVVTQALLKKQQDFFEKGIQYLKPMTLQDVAIETELSESTISRIANSKYIQTDRGTFELRFFFSSSLHNIMQQDDMSSHAVRHKIKELIANENHAKPLSDDQLVKELAQEGIVVARRTITKYREALNISSSYQRKRIYAQNI